MNLQSIKRCLSSETLDKISSKRLRRDSSKDEESSVSEMELNEEEEEYDDADSSGEECQVTREFEDSESDSSLIALPVKATKTPKRTNCKRKRQIKAIRQVLPNLRAMQLDMLPKTEDINLPKVNIKVYPHQRKAIRWMKRRENGFPDGAVGILGDDSGLGEVRTAMAFMLSFLTCPRLTDKEKEMRLLPTKCPIVICPRNATWKWWREAKKVNEFARIYRYYGKDRNISVAELAKYDLVITTPDTIRAEFYPSNRAKANPTLGKILFSRMFVDKAHYLKDWKTNRFRAVSKIHARHRWAITGSPISNKPADFFALCKLLRIEPFDKPKLWDDWIGLNELRENGLERMEMLAKSMIFRRTKKDLSSWFRLPKKVSSDVTEVWLGGSDIKVYEKLCSLGSEMEEQDLSDEEYKVKQAVLALTKQLCLVSPHIMIKNLGKIKDSLNLRGTFNLNRRVFKRKNVSGKIQSVIMALDDFFYSPFGGRLDHKDKIIVASKFTTALDMIGEALARIRRKYSFCKLYGPQTLKQRMDIIKDFNTNPDGPQIMLVSSNVGSAGYDLTGANHILFAEPNWNPQTELQLVDLVHQIGQRKTVYVKRLVVKDTIEDRIVQKQKEKLVLAENLVRNVIKTREDVMSLEEMKALFTE